VVTPASGFIELVSIYNENRLHCKHHPSLNDPSPHNFIKELAQTLVCWLIDMYELLMVHLLAVIQFHMVDSLNLTV